MLEQRAIRSAVRIVGRWQAEVRRCAWQSACSGRMRAARGARTLRERIAAAELDAEYLEQRALAANARRLPPSFREHEPREARMPTCAFLCRPCRWRRCCPGTLAAWRR
jgi:hypothetical protein